MSMFRLARKSGPDTRQSQDVATWLGFAASPTFALMAWISANDMQAMVCAPGSSGLSIGGMPVMYLMMSLFHLSPWLKLASSLARPHTQVQED